MSALHGKEVAFRKLCIYFGWWVYTIANAMPIIYLKITFSTCLLYIVSQVLNKIILLASL